MPWEQQFFPLKKFDYSRFYYDLASKNIEGDETKDQQNLAFFAGYKHELFSIGA